MSEDKSTQESKNKDSNNLQTLDNKEQNENNTNKSGKSSVFTEAARKVENNKKKESEHKEQTNRSEQESKRIATEGEADLKEVETHGTELGTLQQPDLVFEISYLENAQEQDMGLAYTDQAPQFMTGGSVRIKNAFGRLDLKENVLGKIDVKESCRKSLASKDFVVDAQQGIMIKATSPEEWMFRDEKQTKEVFDQKVLDAFRDAQQQINQQQIEKAKSAAQAAKQQQQAQPQQPQGVPQRYSNYQARYRQPPRQQHNQYVGRQGYAQDRRNPYYNPNNDPNRRGQPMPVDENSLYKL